MNQQANPEKARYKRSLKYLLVEPFKQINLGLWVISISLAFTALAGFMIYFALTDQYKQVMEIFMVVDPNKQWSLITNDVFYSNAIKMGVIFVAYLAILMGVVIRKTHKIYGPLISIERFLSQIINGEYRSRIQVRKGDELVGLANRLNQMAAKLEERHGAPDRRELHRNGDELEIITTDQNAS